MSELPERIATAIQEAATSPTQIAADCGISSSTLWRWTKGTSEPSASQLQSLSEATGKPLDYFFDGEAVA
jgi:transcriptional regulator with XRE-family HTH domain